MLPISQLDGILGDALPLEQPKQVDKSEFRAERHRLHKGVWRDILTFGDCQDCRHDHRRHVDGSPFESIVEILSVYRRPVD